MELTKAEEQILHYLWKLEEATVQDILSCMDDARKTFAHYRIHYYSYS